MRLKFWGAPSREETPIEPATGAGGPMKFEDKYLGVLQNIEFAIVTVYQGHRELSDYSVMRALEALLDAYAGEAIGRPPRPFNLSELERVLVERMREICEWRLGRGQGPTTAERVRGPNPPPVSREEIVVCLKRIAKSVKRWNKEGGQQGYLRFVSQYVQ